MADRNRDRHIRDSGLPTNDDSLVTIRGGDSADSDTDSEPALPQFFNPTTPAPKIKCYRCKKFGHFQNKCPTHQRNNPGPNHRFPWQTRRQGWNAFRGSSRAQYPIETDQNKSPDPEEEHKEQDPWITGNY